MKFLFFVAVESFSYFRRIVQEPLFNRRSDCKKGRNAWTVEEDVALHVADVRSYTTQMRLADCLQEAGRGFYNLGGVPRSLSAVCKRRTALLEEYPMYIDLGKVDLVVSTVGDCSEEDPDLWNPLAQKLNMSLHGVHRFYRQCRFWHLLQKDHGFQVSGSWLASSKVTYASFGIRFIWQLLSFSVFRR